MPKALKLYIGTDSNGSTWLYQGHKRAPEWLSGIGAWSYDNDSPPTSICLTGRRFLEHLIPFEGELVEIECVVIRRAIAKQVQKFETVWKDEI